MSETSGYDDFSRQLISGLNDEALFSLVSNGMEALRNRESILVNSLGSLSVDGELHEKFESTLLADGRVRVIHEPRLLIVDGVRRSIGEFPFKMLSLAAMKADQIVYKDEIHEKLWGDGPLNGDFTQAQNLRYGKTLSRLRIALGREDLGDIQSGIIKSIPNTGLIAKTTLQN